MEEFHIFGGLSPLCHHQRVCHSQRWGSSPTASEVGMGAVAKKWVLLGGAVPALHAQRLLGSISSGKLMHFLM